MKNIAAGPLLVQMDVLVPNVCACVSRLVCESPVGAAVIFGNKEADEIAGYDFMSFPQRSKQKG